MFHPVVVNQILGIQNDVTVKIADNEVHDDRIKNVLKKGKVNILQVHDAWNRKCKKICLAAWHGMPGLLSRS